MSFYRAMQRQRTRSSSANTSLAFDNANAYDVDKITPPARLASTTRAKLRSNVAAAQSLPVPVPVPAVVVDDSVNSSMPSDVEFGDSVVVASGRSSSNSKPMATATVDDADDGDGGWRPKP